MCDQYQASAEQKAQKLNEELQQKQKLKDQEAKELEELSRKLEEREQQLVQGGQAFDLAAQQRMELESTEEELRVWDFAV